MNDPPLENIKEMSDAPTIILTIFLVFVALIISNFTPSENY